MTSTTGRHLVVSPQSQAAERWLEKGSASAAEHCGKAHSMPGQRAVAHRVYASVHAVEGTNRDFARDLVL